MKKLLPFSNHHFFVLALACGANLSTQLMGQCRTLPQSGAFVVNGSAGHIKDSEFLLTPDLTSQSGSVWYGNYLDLEKDFNLEFDVFLGRNDGGADGLAFVLQQSPDGTAATSKGGGLGYRYITPSLAVEYDTWRNGEYNDPPMDHIGLQKNGDVIHGSSNEVAMASVMMDMEDGRWHATRIQWTASSKRLSVYWDGGSSPVLEKVINMQDEIFGSHPYVYWGWTGSTGDARNEQKVRMKQVQFTQVLSVTGVTTPASCVGATGSVNISVLGGIAPITYLWSNGAITEDLTQVGPGSYTVAVRDACGNKGEATFVVPGSGLSATIHCPANIVVDNTPGVCGNNNVNYPLPTMEGGCEGSFVQLIAGYPSGGFFDMGDNLVTYQVMGPDGSAGTQCTFTVTVR